MHFLSFLIIFKFLPTSVFASSHPPDNANISRQDKTEGLPSPPRITEGPRYPRMIANGIQDEDYIQRLGLISLTNCPEHVVCTGQITSWSGKDGPFFCTITEWPSRCSAILPATVGSSSGVNQYDETPVSRGRCDEYSAGACIDTKVFNSTTGSSTAGTTPTIVTSSGTNGTTNATATRITPVILCTGKNMLTGEGCDFSSAGTSAGSFEGGYLLHLALLAFVVTVMSGYY